MLTDFGRFIRDYRIKKNGWLLGDILKEDGFLLFHMAKDLGVSSAYLSGCECGRHTIPQEWKTKLPELYPDIDAMKLSDVIDSTNNVICEKLSCDIESLIDEIDNGMGCAENAITKLLQMDIDVSDKALLEKLLSMIHDAYGLKNDLRYQMGLDD